MIVIGGNLKIQNNPTAFINADEFDSVRGWKQFLLVVRIRGNHAYNNNNNSNSNSNNNNNF
jgi:hypothetical protein